LSRETRRRDKDADIDLPPVQTGRSVERAVSVARSEARSGGGAALVPAEPVTPVVWVPPDEDALGVSRRQFLNRATISLTGAGLTTFAAAGFVAFLWPTAKGGFGGKINVGKIDDVIASIQSNSNFFYNATARSWVTQYPVDAVPKAKGVSAYAPVLGGMEEGLVALYQKCPHLGCRVPSCVSSQWFECPCHGSQYNRVGEKKGGPAPRGMDRFVLTVSATSDVIIDTGTVIPGPPIGTNTTGQEAEGPHCIGGGGHG
jgi:cytochrome b6-f complex iron-sulfur subunit